MDSIHTLMRGFQDSAMDVVNLKINRIGGLTASRLFRDLCIKMGITMTIEDSWGGDIATAAIAHLAHSTPCEFHFQSSAFHEYTNIEIASGGPIIKDGYMSVTDRPGLGVEANMDALGEAVFISS
jgi:L-alanine-DL-glutamate epimerase-like enolase superfamily enzyme